MNKSFILCTALMVIVMSYCKNIEDLLFFEMPNVQVLRERINQKKLEYFAKEIDFVEHFSGKKFYMTAVVNQVQVIVHEYSQLNDLKIEKEIVNKFLEILLQDYPEALKELEEKRLYTSPAKKDGV